MHRYVSGSMCRRSRVIASSPCASASHHNGIGSSSSGGGSSSSSSNPPTTAPAPPPCQCRRTASRRTAAVAGAAWTTLAAGGEKMSSLPLPCSPLPLAPTTYHHDDRPPHRWARRGGDHLGPGLVPVRRVHEGGGGRCHFLSLFFLICTACTPSLDGGRKKKR